MNIEVEYIDTNNVISNRNYRISWLGFIKHLAIAGQGYAPKPQKLMRTAGMLLHYWQYFRWSEFYNDRFSEPPIQLSDPTEKGQFSNLAGRAIADFLSKKINQSLFTVNYEAAMRLRKMSLRRVSRPDLIAYTRSSAFALEAKGFSGGFGDMNDHKSQSMTGGIPVNFTVACVSYDIYTKIRNKYYDPYNDNVDFDSVSFQRLTKKYYSGLEGFLNQKLFDYRTTEINGEIFYEVDLFYRQYRNYIGDSPFQLALLDFFAYYRPKLLLPRNIHEYAMSGLSQSSEPFLFATSQTDNVYIDNDRVGLQLERL